MHELVFVLGGAQWYLIALYAAYISVARSYKLHIMDQVLRRLSFTAGMADKLVVFTKRFSNLSY